MKDRGAAAPVSPAGSPMLGVWQSYADVYGIMERLPFVVDLRARHAAAVSRCERVLDCGSGVGLVTAALASNPHTRVTALDVDPSMMARATKRLAGYDNVQLALGDALTLPLKDASVDAYVSNNVLYCVGDAMGLFEEAARVTAPGGVLSVASPRPRMNVEILLSELFAHIKRRNIDVSPEDLERFVDANRVLQRQLKNLHEPDEIGEMLGPRWDIVLEDVVYLEQSFHVVARRREDYR